MIITSSTTSDDIFDAVEQEFGILLNDSLAGTIQYAAIVSPVIWVTDITLIAKWWYCNIEHQLAITREGVTVDDVFYTKKAWNFAVSAEALIDFELKG